MGKVLRAGRPPSVVAAFLASAVAALAVGACGSGDDAATAPSSTATATTAVAAKASTCGLGNGKQASGAPIRLGGLTTKMPNAVGLTDASDLISAYFACVNANGGIHGRPVEYRPYYDQIDPQVTKAMATRMIADDHVDGVLAGLSILDCSVNAQAYAKAGYAVIGPGLDTCSFRSPAWAPVSIGAPSDALSTAQYLVEQEGVTSLAVLSNEGVAGVNEPVAEYAKAKGIAIKTFLEPPAQVDANAVALKAVEAAGDGGGVIVNLNQPLPVLQAVVRQGLQDRARWGCSSACSDASVVKALGSAWDGKLAFNGEYALPDSDGPDAQLFRDVQERYAPKTPQSAFAQMGFLIARIATSALLARPAADLDQKGVNAAFRAVDDFRSDLLCAPWYFGDQRYHMPVNVVRTRGIEDGQLRVIRDCFPLAATPSNHLDEIRAYEREHGIA